MERRVKVLTKRRKSDRQSRTQIFRGFTVSNLAELGSPRTVIDVGAGTGTPALYEAFPSAKFVLVEPLREYEPELAQLAESYDCHVVFAAISDAPGLRQLRVDASDLRKSAFAERTELTRTTGPIEHRTVETTTLDQVFASFPSLPRPILLKLDTEGHELDALAGAKSLLQATDTVIAEVSIAERFETGYEFEDVLLFMRENGFRLFSFLTVVHRPGEPRPRFADAVFQRRDGVLG